MTIDAAYVKSRLDQSGVHAVLRRLGVERFESNGPENWFVSAPYREDRKPSLSVHREDGLWNDKGTGDKGDIYELVMKSTGCPLPDAIELVADAAGIVPNGKPPRESRRKWSPTVAQYPYVNEQNAPLYTVRRTADRNFYPKQSNGQNGYGPRRVLYHLPEVIAAGERWVLLVEGEKDVDRLRELGFVATTSPGGANSWRAGVSSYRDSLRGRKVAIIPDNDEPGWKYAVAVARSIERDLAGPIAREVRIVELPDLGERLQNHGLDVSDWLDAGNTADDLKQIITDAPAWDPDETEVVEDAPQGSETTGPRLVVTSMNDVEEQAVDWIWPRWLARRKFHLLAGYAGDGKSMMSASLIATLSKGGVLPDGTRCDPHRILLLLAEDDLEDTVKPRLRWHGANMANVVAIEAVEDPDGRRRSFSIAQHVELLEPLVVENKIDLLVVDPVSAFMQGSDRNTENVRDVLQPLRDLAVRTGIAVGGIAHVGKSGANARRPLERVLGATAFVAFSRIVWMLAPASQESDEAERVLAVMKSNIGMKPHPLGWHFAGENEPIQWTGTVNAANIAAAFNGGSTSDLSPERRKILDHLKEAGPAKPSTIALDTGLDPKVVSKLLRKMLDDDLVSEVSFGTYDIPPTNNTGRSGRSGRSGADSPDIHQETTPLDNLKEVVEVGEVEGGDSPTSPK